MTRHDLPRCPHCGEWPEDDDATGLVDTVYCATDKCRIQNIIFTEADWSRRPIEAGYEADLIHAREVGDALKRNLEQMKSNFDAMSAIADELAAGLAQLRGL